jgi:hypothetical protein
MGNPPPLKGKAPIFIRALGIGEFVRFILFEIFLSGVCGLIAAAISHDAVSSFMISLLVMVVLLMIESRGHLLMTKVDIHEQLAHVNDELQREITLTKKALAEALHLHQEGLSGQVPFERIREIMTGFAIVQASEDAFFLDRAHELIRHCAQSISEFQHGHMEVQPGDIYSLTRQCLKVAEKSVFATSFARTADFWIVDGGPDYLKENLDAVKAGVHVTRVFILASAKDLHKMIKGRTLRMILSEQVDGGVDVRIAYLDTLRNEWRHDMAIFDDKYVEYLDLETRGAHLYRATAELIKARDTRDRILERALDARTVLERTPPRPRRSRPQA